MQTIKILMWIPFIGIITATIKKDAIMSLTEDNTVNWVIINGWYHGIILAVTFFYITK